MLSAGDPAPDFSLQDQDGTTHTLADYAGRQLLIYFYPRADTPGCTKQSCSVRDHAADLAAKGIAAVGVSPDGAAAQKRFDGKFSLGFPLLCDTERAMIDAYGAWGERTVFGKTGMGLIRSVLPGRRRRHAARGVVAGDARTTRSRTRWRQPQG